MNVECVRFMNYIYDRHIKTIWAKPPEKKKLTK